MPGLGRGRDRDICGETVEDVCGFQKEVCQAVDEVPKVENARAGGERHFSGWVFSVVLASGSRRLLIQMLSSFV